MSAAERIRILEADVESARTEARLAHQATERAMARLATAEAERDAALVKAADREACDDLIARLTAERDAARRERDEACRQISPEVIAAARLLNENVARHPDACCTKCAAGLAERDTLRADLATAQAALGEARATRDGELERIIAVAHKHGWNGVTNSKILSAFLDDALERARAWAARDGEKAWCAEHPGRICTDDLAAFARTERARVIREIAKRAEEETDAWWIGDWLRAAADREESGA